MMQQGKVIVRLRLLMESNERIGRLLLFDDVTQRERMEEQMSQTEKLTSLDFSRLASRTK